MISYYFAGIEIVWTAHAIKRAKTRFRQDVNIENEAIVWAFLRTREETFQVRSKSAILICKRENETTVVVLTCYPSRWKPTPRKSRKVKKQKMKRMKERE